jgi:hypothetical protein
VSSDPRQSSGKTNGERFEEAFNRIDDWLRRRLGVDRRQPFSMNLKAAASDPLVRPHKDTLEEFADLRNAIVHRRGVSNRILANPTDEAVAEIEALAKRFERPRTLRHVRTTAPVESFPSEQPLSIALGYMREKDYSQVVVRGAGEYGAVTNEGIARWLESQIADELVSLVDVTLEDVSEYEPPYTFEYISVNEPVEAAAERFKRSVERLYCLLVTEHGRPNQMPLNILTPWNLQHLA